MAVSFYLLVVLLAVSGMVVHADKRNVDAVTVNQDEDRVINQDEDHVIIPLNLGRGRRNGLALIKLATSGAEQTETANETTPELEESTAAKENATESLTPSESNNEEEQPTDQIVLRLPKRVLCHLIRRFGQRIDKFGMVVKNSHVGRGQHAHRRLSHTLRKLVRELMEMQ